MALEFAAGAIAWATGDAAASTKVVNTLSFQPKAIRFWTFGLSGTFSAAQHWRVSVGFAVGTGAGQRRCVGSYSQDAIGTSNCGTVYRDDAVVAFTDGAAGDVGRLDLTALAADGFTLTVDDVTAFDVAVYWEAWGGSDLTDAEIIEISEPAATGAVDYTLSGAFQGDVVLFAGCKHTTTGALAADQGFCVGAASGASNQFVFAVNADDASALMDTERYCRSDECLSLIVEAGNTSPNARASFTQWNADGFRLTWAERGVTSRKYIALVMKGGQWAVGTYTIDATTTANTTTVSGLAFQPTGVLSATSFINQSASDAVNDDAVLSFGILTTSPAGQVGAGVWDDHAPTTSAIFHAASASLLHVFSADGSSVYQAFVIIAVNSDGFQVYVAAGQAAATWSNACLCGYVVWASAGVPPATAVQDVIGMGLIAFPR